MTAVTTSLVSDWADTSWSRRTSCSWSCRDSGMIWSSPGRQRRAGTSSSAWGGWAGRRWRGRRRRTWWRRMFSCLALIWPAAVSPSSWPSEPRLVSDFQLRSSDWERTGSAAFWAPPVSSLPWLCNYWLKSGVDRNNIPAMRPSCQVTPCKISITQFGKLVGVIVQIMLVCCVCYYGVPTWNWYWCQF